MDRDAYLSSRLKNLMTRLLQIGTLNRKTLVLDPLYFDKDLTQYIRTKNRSRLQQNILKIEAQLKTLISNILCYGTAT